jgi:hypothetical protein
MYGMAGYIDKSPAKVQKETELKDNRVNLPSLPLTGGCQCGFVLARRWRHMLAKW